MGNNPNVIVNNKLFNGNIEETLNIFSLKTNSKIYLRYNNEHSYIDDKINMNCYFIDLYDEKNESYTLKKYFEKYNQVTIEKIIPEPKWGDFKVDSNSNSGIIEDITISRHNVYFSDNLFFPGSWSGFKEYLEDTLENELKIYFNNQIEMFINYSKNIFNSNKMVIFMEYNNDDILEELLDNAKIEDIINDKRWNIIKSLPATINQNNNYLMYYNF